MRTCERGRGIEPGHVRPSLAIETPRGPLQSEAIAGSGPRIATMGVGVEDYCLELGVEPSPDGVVLFYAVSRVVTIAKVLGVQPTGLMGSSAGVREPRGQDGRHSRLQACPGHPRSGTARRRNRAAQGGGPGPSDLTASSLSDPAR